VIIALPEKFRNVNDIQKVYQVLEDYVQKEKVFTLGLADLDKELLEQVFDGFKACIMFETMVDIEDYWLCRSSPRRIK
jgi:hypothetical protein